VVATQDRIEGVVDPPAVKDEVPSETAHLAEADRLQNSLRGVVAGIAAGLDSFEGRVEEQVSQEKVEGLHHDSPFLEGCGKGIADLRQAMVPIGDHEGEPAGRLLIASDDPLEFVPLTVLEVAHPLSHELGTQMT